MVAQVLADPRHLEHYRNPQIAQNAGRANPGEHQQLGRANGTGGQDDLGALNGEPFSVAFNVNADSPVAFKNHPVGRDVGFNSQVQAMPCIRQIGERRAHADAVGVIHRNRAHAGGLWVVHVRVVGMALGAETGVKGILGGQPVLLGVSPHRDGTVTAMEVVVDVGVRLQFP